MKYYRFTDELFLHSMDQEEARVFVETHFLMSMPDARRNARTYFSFYKRDVTDDYMKSYSMGREMVPHVHEFLRNCLLLMGFTGFQVVEQDTPVCDIMVRNEAGQWTSCEEEIQGQVRC